MIPKDKNCTNKNNKSNMKELTPAGIPRATKESSGSKTSCWPFYSCVRIVNVDIYAGTLDIELETEIEIAGFQFEIHAITITGWNAVSGSPISNWVVSTGNNIVLGYTLDGSVIPPGTYTLMTVQFTDYIDMENIGTNICFGEACADCSTLLSKPTGGYALAQWSCWEPPAAYNCKKLLGAYEENCIKYELRDGVNYIGIPYHGRDFGNNWIPEMFEQLEPLLYSGTEYPCCGGVASSDDSAPGGGGCAFNTDSGEWLGAGCDFTPWRGYWVNALTEDTNFYVDPEDSLTATDKVPLHSGVNLVSYWGPDGMSVIDVFHQHTDKIYAITSPDEGLCAVYWGGCAQWDSNGNCLWYGQWMGNLIEMKINKAYWIISQPGVDDWDFYWPTLQTNSPGNNFKYIKFEFGGNWHDTPPEDIIKQLILQVRTSLNEDSLIPIESANNHSKLRKDMVSYKGRELTAKELMNQRMKKGRPNDEI